VKKTDNKFIPSPEQAKLIKLLINFDDRRPLKKILESSDMTRQTYYNWIKDPNFLNYYNAQVTTALKADFSGVAKALTREAKRGSHSHIKTYLEMMDKYTQKVDINVTNDQIKNMSDKELQEILRDEERE